MLNAEQKKVVTGRFKPDEYIEQAMVMAEHYHKGQMRKGADGRLSYYDEHVLGVYNILRKECGIEDADILAIALLHDTVEDTECTFEDIEECFGTEIMEEVKLLTRVPGEPFSVYSRRLFANGTYKTVLVKLADRLHNLRTIMYVSDKRWIEKKAMQTYTDILNPLADAMKHIEPVYNNIIIELADKIEERLVIIYNELDS
ncbi:MAG: HD domain-containing protein [Coprococcus sp.]